MPSTRVLAAAIGALALLPATAHADVTFTARDAAFDRAGVPHAGYARLTVRNATREPHGVLLLRLKRDVPTRRVLKVLETNDEAMARPLVEALGGIQQVDPGGRWQMTERLDAGTYLALDFGSSPKPRVQRFAVAPGRPGRPPRTDGRLVMTDDALTTTLPAPFGGRGTIEIPNRGTGWHELSLVRTPAGTTGQDVLDVIHSGQAPPPGFEPHEALWLLDPGRTAYVRFDLPLGHYVALCLIEGHAERGMITEFDVS